MRRWVVIGLVVIVILAGGVVAQRRTRSATPPPAPTVEAVAVEVAPAQRGTIERTLAVDGSIVSTQRVELTPKIPGRIAVILVKAGDRVSRGQVLARLETAELNAQVAQAEEGVRQAQAVLEVARARLRVVTTGARTQERALAANAVAQAEANLQNAEAAVVRMQQLYDTGAISKQQMEAAILQRDVARAQLDSARQQLSLVETGARPEEVQMAQAQVQQAEAGYAAAQAALRLAGLQLSNATLTAPFAGRIAEVSVAVGEFVAPGVKVLVLYDDSNLEAEVKVGERDLRLLRAGLPVRLEPQAVPTTLRGAVRVIMPDADPASRAARVRIRLQNPPPEVLPGTTVRGEVVIERRENVLLVPTQALRRDGKVEVVVVRDGVARIRRVRLGLTHHHIVEVLEGLQEGELVVTFGPENLSDGQPVKVVTR